tara:strand:- start:797 stop:1144 length:348 start_codon:yes stop_codon:yes gene_type:complete
MIRREFATDGDYKIGTFVDQSPATIQAVSTRLRMFTNEWFLDNKAGTDWYGKVLTKPANLAVAEGEIKQRIVNTEGVREITDFQMTFDADVRALYVEYSATTTWGDTFTDVVGLG